MARNVSFYVERANEAFEKGFTSKAGQKAAMDSVTKAYELLRAEITTLVLGIEHSERTEAHSNVYWDLPSYPHQWKAKHRELATSVFPQTASICDQIEELVALRQALKDAPVVKQERQEDERVTLVQSTIRDMMEKRKAQYARGLELHDIFGGLPVHANVHLVTNQHGTTFLRAFYFMDDKLTPLSVILAVLQTKADEAK